MSEFDDLFNGGLDAKMSFLNEGTSTKNNDGIYRVDFSKVKDKKRGYRSVVRFLPNLTKEGKLGESAIEKIAHYVNIKNPKELSGWFDSPKNFGEKCALSDLYYTMQNSNNAILVEKSKQLNYSRKYYSYVLILEDEQQPELVGKIMIYQYGKTIKDKISAEKNGEISGVPRNVFSLEQGADFVMVVKEIQTGDETYPDYKMSMFRPESTSLPIFKDGQFKNVPLNEDGKIDSKFQGRIKEFLLDREFNLEDFAPKPLTEDQQEKITEITSFLTGKASSSFQKKNESKPTSDDFDFEDNFAETSTTESTEEDDFFSDL
jgi:hypothetical protein